MTRTPRPFPARPAGPPTGFSLIETLTVIAIITILAVLAAPAVSSIIGGLGISSAADAVIGQLKQARQSAITHNRNVELRFYSYNPDLLSDPRYCAMQSFIADNDSAGSWTALNRLQKLPSKLAFDSGTTLSPLIGNQTVKNGAESGVSIPGAKTDYQYVAITFRPDGSATIVPPPSGSKGTFFTIKDIRLPDPASTLPKNYAIVQLFPATGFIRQYRP